MTNTVTEAAGVDGVGVVERYLREGIVAGNDDAVAETVSSQQIKDITAYFRACFTDLALTELGPIFASAGGEHVSCHGQIHMRQVQDFLHVKAVGRAADVDFTGIYQLADGKINRFWVDFDFAQLYA
jgi:hypothetical protein